MVITRMLVAAQLLHVVVVATSSLGSHARSPHPAHTLGYSKEEQQIDVENTLALYATGRILKRSQGFTTAIFIINSADTSALRNLRSSADAATRLRGLVNIDGLAKLPMVLHAQFSRLGLQRLDAYMNELASPGSRASTSTRRYFVDLRGEHVFFVETTDGQVLPISLFTARNNFNQDKAPADIAIEYQTILTQLRQRRQLVVYQRTKKSEDGAATELYEYRLPLRGVYSEQQLVEGLGGHYRKFYVSDHQAPTPATLDEFVHFYNTEVRGSGAFMSLHCQAGRGRTSTFGAIVDILENAPRIPFQDILQRQHLMGGIDFDKFSRDYRQQDAHKRRLLLESFYRFVSEHSARRDAPSFASWYRRYAEPQIDIGLAATGFAPAGSD